MNYFWYYAGHSIWNQLRKLFKTWVLIFFVDCIVLGGLIGVGIGVLEDMDEPDDPGTEIEEPVEPDEPMDPILVMNLTEAITGGIALVVISLNCLGADKNGSAIFQPADVCILFTSPLKPQSVLLFRMLSLMGTMVIASIYMAFQIPNLVMNFNLSLWAAVSFVVAWLLVLTFGQLLKTFIYMVTSTKPAGKKYIMPSIFGIYAIACVAYLVHFKAGSESALDALFSLFNNGVGRALPIVGWVKAIVHCAMTENFAGFIAYLAISLAFIAIFVFLMWRMKVDFYEDAMAKSEETAALQEAAKENGGFARKKKDRPERIKRNNFNKGFGANVYFFKSMYNRRRFASFGIFTKTSWTYLCVATLASIIVKNVSSAETSPSFTVVGIAFGAIAFYRSLGNPLERDTQSQYFVLIPASIEKKMFWSILGSSTDCLLDLLPGAVIATAVLGSNPFISLAWLVFVVSIDMYATVVGVFINLSVPVSAGKDIKQVVQIMFIYFGLLPDIALIAVGIVTKNLAVYAVIATILNLLIFALFFALAQNFIDPKEEKAISKVVLGREQLKSAKNAYSRCFFMPVIITVVALVIQIAFRDLVLLNHAEWLESELFVWMYSMVPMYLIGLPLAVLNVKSVPVMVHTEKKKLKPLGFLGLYLMAQAVMYVGSFGGTAITLLITELSGLEVSVGATEMISSSSMVYTILFAVIIGPIVEELVFRKLFIDRTRVYGKKLAIVSSALAFGLYHGNITQGIYASCLGFLLGYIYEKYGDIKITIGLHMCINCMGGVISQLAMKGLDTDALINAVEQGDLNLLYTPGNIAFGIYLTVIVLILISGLFLLLLNIRNIGLDNAELELQKGKRFSTRYVNFGFSALIITFVIMCLQSFGIIVF